MIEIREIGSLSEMQECWDLRLEVFVREQHVPEDEERDAWDTDEKTIHLVVKEGESTVGTARVVPDGPGRCHIGRVALRKSVRGTGLGRALIDKACECALDKYGRVYEDEARGRCVLVELSAQEYAIGFYELCGFSLKPGERYMDAGIWHRDMERMVYSSR